MTFLNAFKIFTSAALSFSLLTSAHAKDFAHVDAAYQVYYNGSPSNTKNTLTIDNKDGRYHLDFRAEHMLGSIKQQATFDWSDCKATPINSYYKLKAIGFSKKERVTYDHDNNIAKVRGSKEKDLPIKPETNDNVSFFLEARCNIMNGAKEFSFPTVNKARIKTVTYRVVGEESVSTPLGTYDAIKVERVHRNKKRKTELWVAPELDYMLVQMHHYENSVVSGTIKLKSLDYSLVDTLNTGAIAASENNNVE